MFRGHVHLGVSVVKDLTAAVTESCEGFKVLICTVQ
jgi:hypothetical protein